MRNNVPLPFLYKWLILFKIFVVCRKVKKFYQLWSTAKTTVFEQKLFCFVIHKPLSRPEYILDLQCVKIVSSNAGSTVCKFCPL